MYLLSKVAVWLAVHGLDVALAASADFFDPVK